MSPSHIPISQLHVSFRFSSFFFHNPLSPFSTYGHGHGASQCHGKLASGNILKREWFSLSQHLSSANSFSWGVGRGEHTAHPHILEFWLVWPCAVAMSCPEGGIAEHLSPSSSSYSFTSLDLGVGRRCWSVSYSQLLMDSMCLSWLKSLGKESSLAEVESSLCPEV